jgi:hypothetical protein
MCWHLSFAAMGLTRSLPQPSARFPWINDRSRNQSPPVQLYRQDTGAPVTTANRKKEPLQVLAVAEDAPAGAKDRQGRGRSTVRASPEMKPGSHRDDWAATPQAADQPR